jgi:hypothetical protein
VVALRGQPHPLVEMSLICQTYAKIIFGERLHEHFDDGRLDRIAAIGGR